MNKQGHIPVRKWWMGWPGFFRILSGTTIVVLVWALVALNLGMDFSYFTASDSVAPGVLILGEVGCLVVLAFLFICSRFWLARLLTPIWRWLRWLFSWRMIRRYLYGLAGCTLVAACFYAEEDWRGKRDWDQYRSIEEAKGERFDPASFITPLPPAGQNFAFSPIVSNSCVSRTGSGPDVEGVKTNLDHRLQVSIEARSGRKSWPTNDFLGNWQLGKRVDLKVFQAYYRAPVNSSQAGELQANQVWRGLLIRRAYRPAQPAKIQNPAPTNEFPVAPQAQSPPADVLLALSKYDSALEELRQASQRPFFIFPFQSRPETTNRFLVADLAPLEGCVLVLRLRAVAELYNGQSEKALQDVKLIFSLANLGRHEPWREYWREYWRIYNINLAMQPVWQGLVDHMWSDPQLAAIEEDLARFDFFSDYQYFVRSSCAETIAGIDFLEKTRFRDFWAQIHFGSDQDNNSLWQRVFQTATLMDFIPQGWFYKSEVEVARMSRQALPTAAEVDRRILSPDIAKRFNETWAYKYQHRSPCNIVATSMCPDYAQGLKKYALAQSFVDQARVACLLERHRLAKGKYPAALVALTPAFIAKLPGDIINAQPLHYQPTGNGRFLLYSVGWNGTDEGGLVVRRPNKLNASLDVDQGDWVWPDPQ